jgi:hypothetical protein
VSKSQTVIGDDVVTFTTTGRSIQEQRERNVAITFIPFILGSICNQRGVAGRRLSVCWEQREQHKRALKEEEFFPKTWDLVDAAVAYKETTGRWPVSGLIMTNAFCFDGDAMVIVQFNPNGVNIGHWPCGCYNPNLQSARAWES